MFFNLVAVSSLLAIGAQAASHTVNVGANAALAFDPPQLTGVADGDDVQFVFMSKNHTVTQSSFAEPCKALDGGVNSGFVKAPNGTDAATMPTWTITINNASAPLWFYCRQKTPAAHCAAGMVFSLNPTAEKTHDAFVAAAKASTDTSSGAAGAAASGSASASASSTADAGAASASAGADTASQAASANSNQPNGAKSVAAGSLASVLAVFGVIATLL